MTKPDGKPAWAVYALTRQGAEVAARLAEGLAGRGGAGLYLPVRLKELYQDRAEYFISSAEALAANFRLFDGHLVVGAAGLVVRHLAPLVKSKKEDPAVVVLSQDGRWSISLLSGHLGGGNSLARTAADILGAQAVITTATDVEQLPAVEMLAREADLEIEDFARLPAVSRRLVEGGRLPVYDPGARLLPLMKPWAEHFEILDRPPSAADGPALGVDYRLGGEEAPQALILRPQVLALGLGCHKGLASEALEAFVQERLQQAGLAEKSVAKLATVEIRKDEAAMLDLSRKMNRPLLVFSREELEKVKTPNPSAMVLKRIGVPSVCEAAALLASGSGELIISKQKGVGCTLAAALIAD